MPDVTAPTVASAQLVARDTMRIVFSERMKDDASLRNPASYYVALRRDPSQVVRILSVTVARTGLSVDLELSGVRANVGYAVWVGMPTGRGAPEVPEVPDLPPSFDL
jgi:hypothetical protein